jgi:hypothetical protein
MESRRVGKGAREGLLRFLGLSRICPRCKARPHGVGKGAGQAAQAAGVSTRLCPPYDTILRITIGSRPYGFLRRPEWVIVPWFCVAPDVSLSPEGFRSVPAAGRGTRSRQEQDQRRRRAAMTGPRSALKRVRNACFLACLYPAISGPASFPWLRLFCWRRVSGENQERPSPSRCPLPPIPKKRG